MTDQQSRAPYLRSVLEKPRNCQEWASFEPPGSSATAALCHGGIFEGSRYGACESRVECKAATIERTLTADGKRHLPILNPTSGARTLAAQSATPSYQQPQSQFKPMQFRQANSLPGSGSPQFRPQTFETAFPQPIIPPENYPAAMRTPYASTAPTGGSPSPTFLPKDGENVFERLSKNVIQGAIASTGWHLFDYARSIDLFR